MIMEHDLNQKLFTRPLEIQNPVTPNPTGVRNENINPVQIGPCNHSLDSNSKQLPVNMNASLNRNPLTPDRQVYGGGNGIDNPEYSTMVEYSGERKPESEKELCDTINEIKNNFITKTRKKGVEVRFKIGQEILHYYKGQYGQNEMKRIAENTGITLSALYKYIQLAKNFSQDQITWFMKFDYISYRLVAACLSIDNKAEIHQVFTTSINAKEADNKIKELKRKESAKDIPTDNVSDSIDPDNKTAPDTMDNTDKETSEGSNVAAITEKAKEQVPKHSESSTQQAAEKDFEAEQNKCQQDGQSSQANEPEANVNASQSEESQVTNGEHDKLATEKRTPSADTDGNQQKETQDGEAQSPAEQKNPEQLSAAPQQEQEEAGVGSDCQKNQDFSNDDNENNPDSGAENAHDKAIDKDVNDIASGNLSLPNLLLNHNLGGVQSSFPYVYETIERNGNILINASKEKPVNKDLRKILETIVAELTALLPLVPDANYIHSGATISGEFKWASSFQSAVEQV